MEMKKYIRHLIRNKYRYIFLTILLLWFCFSLPNPLFNNPYATVLLSKNQELLEAHIADDGQWRFPPSDSVPYKFKQALIQFEDAYFYRHPGVNPISLIKALYQDIKSGKIVRGGSTLTMQVIRLSRKNPDRNIYQKLIEIILALRLECSYSKDEILNLYASHAPFGGNVVGLEAASWRYFGRPSYKLSWGESATLAVLPNAPSLIYPGKNHQKLLIKRNRLLDKLQQAAVIDSITCELAKSEPLPGKPLPLPHLTPHLLQWAKNQKGQRIHSSIDKNLQNQINEIAKRYYSYLRHNKIYNMGIIVVDVNSGKIVAYTGNILQSSKAPEVDMIQGQRSTGSLIKPFLYAWALKDGDILPGSLLKDIPTHIAGYHPKNFNKSYDGMVPANEALARSLNVPAVRLLKKYGLQKFYDQLQRLPLTTIKQPAEHYGLTLILGGAEIKLFEATGIYAGMARSLNRYNLTGYYYDDNYVLPDYRYQTNLFSRSKKTDNSIFGAGNIWFVFEALSDKNRPVEGDDWNIYRSAQKIAWKTGTSFGHRDAWCVGVTPRYAVGVWVGNATGEGRPGLTGVKVAAPVMFDVFELLPASKWFDKPLNDLKQAEICSKSGFLAGENCEEKIVTDIPQNGERSKSCPYHRLIHLNKKGKRVNSSCYPVTEMIEKKFFVLPPLAAWYYRKKHIDYQNLPPWDENCQPVNERNMDLIYPKNNARIFLPKDFNNEQQSTVFKAVHYNPNAVIYWHIDDKFIGKTQGKHQLDIYANPGKHILTLIDNQGEIIKRNFEIVK
jgi:penicillin-binding protein 1C